MGNCAIAGNLIRHDVIQLGSSCIGLDPYLSSEVTYFVLDLDES